MCQISWPHKTIVPRRTQRRIRLCKWVFFLFWVTFISDEMSCMPLADVPGICHGVVMRSSVKGQRNVKTSGRCWRHGSTWGQFSHCCIYRVRDIWSVSKMHTNILFVLNTTYNCVCSVFQLLIVWFCICKKYNDVCTLNAWFLNKLLTIFERYQLVQYFYLSTDVLKYCYLFWTMLFLFIFACIYIFILYVYMFFY